MGVILLDLPVILCFILASLYALAVCGVLKGGFRDLSNGFSYFTEGVKDTSSLVAFWITLAMFNDAAFLRHHTLRKSSAASFQRPLSIMYSVWYFSAINVV